MLSRHANEPLVGLVVVTHGGAADCLLQAAASIVGPLEAAAAVSVRIDETFADTVQHVSGACERVDRGVGVVILVDLQGSSPYQACMAMMDGSRMVEVVCGVNMAMLVKLSTVDRRQMRPAEVAVTLRDVGRRSIRLGSELTGRVALGETAR